MKNIDAFSVNGTSTSTGTVLCHRLHNFVFGKVCEIIAGAQRTSCTLVLPTSIHFINFFFFSSVFILSFPSYAYVVDHFRFVFSWSAKKKKTHFEQTGTFNHNLLAHAYYAHVFFYYSFAFWKYDREER